MSANAKAQKNYQILKKFLNKNFPKVTTALQFKTPFQLLVATILSAQCTDVLVNKVTPGLFKKYPGSKKMSAANLERLKKDIYPVTFYNNKAKSLKAMALMLEKDYKGVVPKTMEELLKLPGVARKTANVVLGHVYGISSGVVVDTHVMRVSGRFGLSTATDPKKIEQDLMKIIPKKDWVRTSDQIIWFGRKICSARNDKCANYREIAKICSEAGKVQKASNKKITSKK